MFKSKVHFAFYKSLKSRLIFMIFVLVLVPEVVLCFGILNTYESRAVSIRESEVLSQAKILANKISTSKYFDKDGSDLSNIDAQIDTLTTIYEGRVLIVDKHFKIIKDTYNLDDGNTIVSEEVIKTFSASEITNYDSKNHYIELSVPISNPNDKDSKIEGALVVSVSTDNISLNMSYLTQIAVTVAIIAGAVVLFFGVLVLLHLFVPIKKLSDEISDIKDGFGKEQLDVDDYAETAIISRNFNELMSGMKVMDESRQEFVSNVSHELKTPITSMKVLADSLIQNESADLAMYKEFMTDIVDEIDRESKIITDLLTLVKMDKKSAAMNIEEIKINDLLEVILKRVTPIAKSRGIQITYESYRDVTAWVDEVKLSLALTNIIENAVKYNVDNGWVKVTLNADHRNFYVKVADSGVGIPDDCKEHVFERFYRVDKARSRDTGGTGLGLAITKSVIQMHKGSIKLYSESGEGTTFTIRIPMKSDASVDTARKEGDAE